MLGARQVGKTTLLKALEAESRDRGLTTAFFDLEQPAVLASFNRSPEEIQQNITAAGSVVFIDEFQYIANASKIFKAILDSGSKVKIFCSGSSSLEIHQHLQESLAGRRILYRIPPLRYAEIATRENLYAYLTFGGMPGLTQTELPERRQTILSELLSSYIMKDVTSLVKEENLRAFNHLLYLLAENQGSLLSVHSLANQIRMSSKAVNRYLDILESTYVNFRIHSYSRNLGNELKKSHKSYLYDLGVRNALLLDFSAHYQRTDGGAILETFVFLSLHARLRPNMELRFWRTKEGLEVDFLLLVDRKPIPIEVKSQPSSLQVPRGIAAFLKRYPETSRAFVVSESLSGSLTACNTEVRFLSFEELDSDAFFPFSSR